MKILKEDKEIGLRFVVSFYSKSAAKVYGRTYRSPLIKTIKANGLLSFAKEPFTLFFHTTLDAPGEHEEDILLIFEISTVGKLLLFTN